jgi:hypothetical protein
MAHVVGEPEAVVIHPDRNALVRDVAQALAKARHQVEVRFNGVADAFDVDAAAAATQRPHVENHDAAHVHVVALVFETQKRRVECAQAFVIGHDGPPRREQTVTRQTFRLLPIEPGGQGFV